MKNLEKYTHREVKIKTYLVFKDFEEYHSLCMALEFIPLHRWNDCIIEDITFIKKRLRNLSEREDGTLRTKLSKTITENVDWALKDFHHLSIRYMSEDLQNAVANLFEEI